MELFLLKMDLRRIANAIIDISAHSGMMNEAQAMRLMTEQAFQEEEEAQAKIRRAALTSCQLPSYFMGKQAWLRLREKARETWGDEYTQKRFHDEALSKGGILMDSMEAVLLPVGEE
jgi:uncharacterized protein (DUF885 family)